MVALAGFWGLILQLRSQARQAREAIAENERRKIKAEMYERAVSSSREVADAAIALSTQLRMMSVELRIASEGHRAGLGYPLPATRFRSILSLHGNFSDAVLRFIFLIENRRIIDPRLIVFRTAMNPVLHDTRKIINQEFPLHVMPALPIESPQGPLFPYTPPSEQSLVKINLLCEQMFASLNNAVSYTEDFLVEMQNRLLGDLFANEVCHRVPLDPNSKVITLTNAEKLEQWFQTSTDWGQEMAKVTAEVRARLKHGENDGD